LLDYAPTPPQNPTLLGHPCGLFLLFLVEMWERFSYYGMRGLLVLYLVTTATGKNPGRGMSKESASDLYGWYTGMAYLLPIFGGLIADKLIGAHRSMLIGGLIIALGHISLAISGLGNLGQTSLGMAIFIGGLALIVIGTGHFKPNVSVMVGSLYAPDDPRRDSAFTIFYMGINLGAFICSFICGTLGEKVGWHWGFGAAAVGMLAGLITYVLARPKYLPQVGLPPANKGNFSYFFLIFALLLSADMAIMYYTDAFAQLGQFLAPVLAPIRWLLLLIIIAVPIAFITIQRPGERGPVTAILIFIIFNAVFWLAFEQAGTSLNLFAEEMTNRHLGSWEMPATWFQSVEPALIILLAPLFARLWSYLAFRGRDPSQAIKLALSLFVLGAGYGFMVLGSIGTSPTKQASMFWLMATYTLFTFGELGMSPTGLSFVTRAAPVRFVSLLMGTWFLSNSLANWLGGRVAGQIEKIENGQLNLPWYHWFKLGGQADFFLLFVISSVGAGLLMLILTPLINRLLGENKV
jgi:proton-dependent oligopeptide transporter, POT family